MLSGISHSRGLTSSSSKQLENGNSSRRPSVNFPDGKWLQPLILILGPTLSIDTAFYVTIDVTRYRFQNILSALDLCLKSFHVLHAQ